MRISLFWMNHSSFRQIPTLFALFLTLLLQSGCKDSSRGATSDKPPVRYQLNMYVQDKGKAQAKNSFFEDGRVMRPVIPETISTEDLIEEGPLYNNGISPIYTTPGDEGTKKDQPRENPAYVQHNPLPITMDLMQRGKERYDIYCAPCHGTTGHGDGTVRKRAGKSWELIKSLHSDDLRKLTDGYLFYVITHGYSTMPSYRAQIPMEDRWAIISYVRALQRSQNASLADVPAEKRSELK